MKRTKTNSSDRELSAEKTGAILEGAIHEFLTHGYAATSMDKVAAAAGVSKATVYSHFQNKEELFTALIQRFVKKKFPAIFSLQDSQSPQGEPSTVLRHFAANLLDTVTSDPQLLAFMRLIIGESGRFPELARAYVRNLAQPGIRVLSQYLASRSELKLPDPEATVRVIVGTLVYFLILQEMLQGKDILPMERDRLIDTLIRLVTASN